MRFNAVATSAVREATNGGDFIQRVEDEVGLRVKVIPGREEARLIYLGVRHAIDLRGEPTLIVDIGGGSVELILIDDEQAGGAGQPQDRRGAPEREVPRSTIRQPARSSARSRPTSRSSSSRS